MKLYDLLPNTATIMDEAFKHPVMKIKPRAANPYPTKDDAIKAVVNAIEHGLLSTVADEMKPLLEDILLNYELMNGEQDESDDPAEWEAGLDDMVEASIEKYVPVLSQDWLGTHTIGSGIHLHDGIKKFSYSLGREVFKQLTYGENKSPVKIMSAAGIVIADVEKRLELHNQPLEEKSMSKDTATDLDDIIQKVADYVGADYDVLTIYEEFEMASDDDDILAHGAASRLGLEAEEIEPLRDNRLMEGDEVIQGWMDRLAELVVGEKKKPVRKTATPKPKAEKPAAKAKAEKPEVDVVGVDVFQKIKSGLEFKEVDIAQRLGVSRATYNNWANGKTAAELSDAQRTELRDELVTRANLLLEALGVLDGADEPQVVF